VEGDGKRLRGAQREAAGGVAESDEELFVTLEGSIIGEGKGGRAEWLPGSDVTEVELDDLGLGGQILTNFGRPIDDGVPNRDARGADRYGLGEGRPESDRHRGVGLAGFQSGDGEEHLRRRSLQIPRDGCGGSLGDRGRSEGRGQSGCQREGGENQAFQGPGANRSATRRSAAIAVAGLHVRPPCRTKGTSPATVHETNVARVPGCQFSGARHTRCGGRIGGVLPLSMGSNVDM
jgi:hypothetical protein